MKKGQNVEQTKGLISLVATIFGKSKLEVDLIGLIYSEHYMIMDDELSLAIRLVRCYAIVNGDFLIE